MIELSIFFALLAQQPPPQNTLPGVEGTVVNALNGQSLRKATVVLRSTDNEHGVSYAEEVDSNGHFQIENMQPGEYTVTAERPGYLQKSSGAPGAPAPRLKIAAGDSIQHLLIKMAPAPSISGRVLDADGEPVRNATVQVMQYVYVAGRRELRPGIQVQTRETGEYRLFNLRPGRWYIQVTARPYGQMSISATGVPRPVAASAITFYPGARDAASATPVELHAGDDLRGYDITMRTEATFHVRFTLRGDYQRMVPQLLNRDGTWPSRQFPSLIANGLVDFMDVPPGAYTIFVSRNDAAATTYARLDIDVANADVDAGVLDFQPAHELSGLAKVDGAPPRFAQNVRVRLQPDGASIGRIAEAQIKPDGSFVLNGIPPGFYRVQIATAPVTLYVKSIRLGDQALPDQLLDLTRPVTDPLALLLGDDVGEIEGAVKKASGQPSIHARMTLIPDGAIANRAELFRFVFSDEQGEFKFQNVVPGDYKLFAWEDVLAGMPQDPDFRSRFEKQSVAVTVTPHGRQKVDATSISVAAARDDSVR